MPHDRRLVLVVLVALVALVVLVCGAGCGNQGAQSLDVPDAATDVPIDASISLAPDLRFQWVGAFSSYSVGGFANEGVSGGAGGSLGHSGPLGLSPLQMTTTGLVPGNYDWSVMSFRPQVAIEDLRTIVKAGPLASLATDVSELIAQGHVITSLDLMPDAYALVATAPVSGVPSYPAATIETDRSNLGTWAAGEGARGRVVTAVSANGSLIHAQAFGRTGDPAAYETRIVDATSETLAAQAVALAADGYIVTAFGRSGPAGLILIGTRVAGVTTPRSIRTQTTRGASLEDGYAIVAWVFAPDLVPDHDLAILER